MDQMRSKIKLEAATITKLVGRFEVNTKFRIRLTIDDIEFFGTKVYESEEEVNEDIKLLGGKTKHRLIQDLPGPKLLEAPKEVIND
jgi:hypothetical protein